MSLTGETPKISKKTIFSTLITKHGTILAISLIVLFILFNSFLNNNLGLIGKDSDDVMRLVQIKDYLAGQSWFHTDQYRMGLAGGTDMHWSRIPDIPILILTHFFDIFLSQDRALIWAFTVWPPLSAAILMCSLCVAAKNWGGEKTKLFTFILMGIFLITFYRFAPGAIDHHNLQLGFLAMSMAFLLDPKMRFWSYFVSGCAAAISIAIGVEIYLFAAVICGFVAINWAFTGQKSVVGTQGFGVGFSAMLMLTFVGTIHPSEYTLIYCDALSLITVTAGVLGGMGLVIITKVSQLFNFNKRIFQRVLMLIVLGGVCTAVLLTQAPQCLVNPLDSLPDEVNNLWLDSISEARSITQIGADKFQLIPFMLGAPIVALIVLILDIKKNIGSSVSIIHVRFLLLALLIMALMLTFYQMRFYPFAYIFAIVPLAAWLSNIYVDSKLKNPSSVIYLLALVVSVPAAWTVPGLILESFEVEGGLNIKKQDKKSAKCKSMSVLKSLKALPKGTISADSDMTGFILEKTNHRAVSGNYHRNWKGISTEIKISVSDPDISEKILTEENIDYLYYCSSAVGAAAYINHNENGLIARIDDGDIPNYLERVSPPDLENGEAMIFKVKRPEN